MIPIAAVALLRSPRLWIYAGAGLAVVFAFLAYRSSLIEQGKRDGRTEVLRKLGQTYTAQWEQAVEAIQVERAKLPEMRAGLEQERANVDNQRRTLAAEQARLVRQHSANLAQLRAAAERGMADARAVPAGELPEAIRRTLAELRESE